MSTTSDSGLLPDVQPPPIPQAAIPPAAPIARGHRPPPVRRPPVQRPATTPLVQEKPARSSVKSQPVPSEEATSDETQEPKTPWFSLRNTPSWLVSLSVHLALLVLLALLTVTSQPKLLATIIDGTFDEASEPLEQLVELNLEPLENIEHMSAAPVGSELAVVDVSQVGGEAANIAIGSEDLQVDAVSDIGGLFTGDAPGMNDSGMSALKGAEFFGVKAAGRKFVFVVDSSNSMKNGKFDAAKEELEYAIRRLSPEQLFYVIFFDQDAERMILTPETEPEVNVVPATSTNINRFVTWMRGVKNELRTDPYEAVKFALSLRPDAIYILSDGKFTDRGQTVRYLKEANVIDDPETGKRPRAVVHTIAFWQRDGEEAMQDIAKTHQGTYRFVPPARK